MNKKHDLLGVFLASVTALSLLALLLLRAFLPRFILPTPSGSHVILLSLIALVLDHYLACGSRRDYRLIPLYAALIFGLFPLVAFLLPPLDCLILALMSAVIFTILTFLFDAMVDRISSGSASARLAPLVSAFGLYLATQCLTNII